VVEYPVSRWCELILAYACTIHKMQGSQATAAVIVASSAHAGMLDRTILYTGWTRPEELLFVVGERSALEDAVSRRASDLRWTRLAEFVERAALECGFAPAKRDPELSRQASAAPAPGHVQAPPRVMPVAVRPAAGGPPPRVAVPPQPGGAPGRPPDAAPPESSCPSRSAVPRIVLPRPAPAFGPRPGG
jgi:exodeoxyribonuclease V alpha subunit